MIITYSSIPYIAFRKYVLIKSISLLPKFSKYSADTIQKTTVTLFA